MSQLDFVAKVKIEPDTSQYRQQLDQQLKAQTPLQAPSTGSGSFTQPGSYTQQVKLEAQARLQALNDSKARLLVDQAERRATDELSGSYSTVADRLEHVGRGGTSAAAGMGASVAKIGLIGFAVTAGFQAFQRLEKAITATGDAAFTTQGRIQNAGAALLKGDLIGSIDAITRADERLNVKAEALKLGLVLPPTASEQMQKFADANRDALKATEENLAAQERIKQSFGSGVRAGSASYLEEQAKGFKAAREEGDKYAADLREIEFRAYASAKGFDALAKSLADAAQAGSALEENLTNINGIPTFGITDISGEVAAGRARDAGTANATDANAASIADRTETLTDNLVAAQAREKRARDRLTTATREDREAAYSEVVKAHTAVIAIERQIKAERERQAKADAAAAKSAADDAKAAYTQGIANQAERLRQAADAAGNRGATEKKLLGFLAAEAKDARLDTSVQLQYSAELIAERNKQKAALVAAAKADIDYRRSLLDLAVQRAEVLTPNDNTDNEKAYKNEIAFWAEQKKKAQALGKAGREAVVEAESQRLTWVGKLRNLKSSGGYSLRDLFQASADQFAEFGSNVSTRPSTPGQAVGRFSGDVVRNILRDPEARRDLGLKETAANTATTNTLLRTLISLAGGAPDKPTKTTNDPMPPAGYATSVHQRKLSPVRGPF